MKLYVIRHGKTVWNENGITQGRSKNRLSKTGKNDVELVSKSLLNKKIDLIISSPLTRTVQTSNIINKYLKVKIIKDEDLIEIDQGIFTGVKRSTLNEQQLKQKLERSKETKMESYEDAYKRVQNFLNRITLTYKDKNVLVVTHNCIASFIENILLKKEINFKDRKFVDNFKNSQIKIFEI